MAYHVTIGGYTADRKSEALVVYSTLDADEAIEMADKINKALPRVNYDVVDSTVCYVLDDAGAICY